MKRIFAFVFVLFLLFACDGQPTPTPDIVATEAAVQRAAAATLTAEAPTSTPTPSSTVTPAPTLTPTPSPTPSPTLTPTQTPTPTSTVQPHVQLEAASRSQVSGDYVESILAYSDLLDDEEAMADQVCEARYRLAEAYLHEGEYVTAGLAWEDFIARYPDDSRLPQAMLMAGRAFQAANQCDRAIAHYQTYLQHATILEDMVYEWIGDCHAADDRLEFAVGAYRQAVGSTDDPHVQIGLREKIANAHLALEEYQAAVTEYDAILNLAEDDDYRAKLEYLAGQALEAAGETEAAVVGYQRAIKNYPKAEHAYFALVELVYGGEEVDEFLRGLVDYYAGAKYPDAYGASIGAFDRYLASGAAEKADEALYYKALDQRAVGQVREALVTLEQMIAGHPDSEMLVQAWQEKAATLAEAGDHDAAIEAYRELATQFPESEHAPEALWEAARLHQGAGTYAEAAGLYEELQHRFPTSEDPDAALWYAGLARYRADELEKAVGDWQSLLDTYPDSIYAPKTRYWLGKVGAQPEAPDATGYWEQLLAEMPERYYALRAEQLNAGESLTTTRLISLPVEAPLWDGAQYEAEILPWLRSWTTVPTDTESLTLPVTVTQTADLARGQTTARHRAQTRGPGCLRAHPLLGGQPSAGPGRLGPHLSRAGPLRPGRQLRRPHGRSLARGRHPRRTADAEAPRLPTGLRRPAVGRGPQPGAGPPFAGRPDPPGEPL